MGKLNSKNEKIKAGKSTKLLKLLQIIYEVAKYWNPCLSDSKMLSVYHVLTITYQLLLICLLLVNKPTPYLLPLIFDF